MEIFFIVSFAMFALMLTYLLGCMTVMIISDIILFAKMKIFGKEDLFFMISLIPLWAINFLMIWIIAYSIGLTIGA